MFYRMTNETQSPMVEDPNRITTFQQNLSVTSAYVNDEPKRRVSISQAAIQADIEKQKRKNSCISFKSVHSNGESNSNCYINPAFQHSSLGNKRTFLFLI